MFLFLFFTQFQRSDVLSPLFTLIVLDDTSSAVSLIDDKMEDLHVFTLYTSAGKREREKDQGRESKREKGRANEKSAKDIE